MRTIASVFAFCTGVLVASCGSSVKEMPGPNPNPNESRATAPPPAKAHRAPPPSRRPRAKQSSDAPEISRSVGRPGGAVVLWPRIVLPRDAPAPDASVRALARDVQAQLAASARDAHGADQVDVRPEPERVCPRGGCKAVSVGALVTRAGEGCAVLALVSGPGESPARIVPWIGRVRLDQGQVGFREPPERHVRVDDYVPCDQVPALLRSDRKVVDEALRRVR